MGVFPGPCWSELYELLLQCGIRQIAYGVRRVLLAPCATDSRSGSGKVKRDRMWIAPLLALCAMVAGCGELAWKRGARDGDLAQARNACHQAADLGAYEKCMDAQGWTVTSLDAAFPAPFLAPATPGAAPAAAASPGPGQKTPTTPALADPLEKFKVDAWWKFGGTDGDFKASLKDCTTQLDTAHTPPPGNREMTRGLLACLRGHGWYASAHR